MTGTDQLARRAGEDLRGWDPEAPLDDPSAAFGAARRRRRSTRLALAGAVAAALVATGVWIGTSDGGHRVETRPAGPPGSPTTATTDAIDAADAVGEPSTTTPSTVPEPTTSIPSTTVAPAAPVDPPPAPTGSCRAPLAGGGSYAVSLPAGWFANEEHEGEPACTYLGPEPIVLRDYQEGAGWASNAEVVLLPSPEPGLPGYASWEEYLVSKESHGAAPPEAQLERVSTRRETVAGRPALREEFVEGGVNRWVRWTALLGDTVVIATAGSGSPTGLSYDEKVAALDGIVTTMRFEG